MIRKKDIVLFYTKAKMEADAAETYLGFVWWIVDPILSALVYFLLFEVILHRGGPGFILFLFVGIVSWKWFQSGVVSGSSSILSQKNLYRKVNLPKIVFPWIEVGFTTMKFLASLLVVSTVCLLLGRPVTLNHLFLPLVIGCQFVFIIGFAVLLASVTPFVPDFTMILNHLFRLAFYVSGILFSVERIPERLRFIVDYNPMAQAVIGFRSILLDGAAPPVRGMALLLICGAILYAVGSRWIHRNEGQYVKLA